MSIPNDFRQDNRNNRGCGQTLGCLNIFVIGAIFVLMMGITLPTMVTAQVLLTPGTYKQALERTDFYNRYAGLFVEQMVYTDPNQLRLEGLPCINVSEFSRKDWTLITVQLTPPTWIKAQTESLIDQVFALPENNDPEPALWISTLEFKNLLAGSEGFTFYQGLIAEKHTCTFNDIFDITAWALNPYGSCLAVCRPLEIVDLVVEQILPTLAQSIPENYSLTPFIGAEVLIEIRQYLIYAERTRTAAIIAALSAFALLLLTLLSRSARTCSGWLISWGGPLTLAGLLIVGEAIFLPLVSRSGLIYLLSGVLAPSVMSFGEEFALEITKTIAIYSGLAGLAFFISGLTMLSISAIVRAVQGEISTR
jgi:hypothetical protein